MDGTPPRITQFRFVKGFTLIEVVLGLVLSTFIFASVGRLCFLCQQNWQSTFIKNQLMQNARRALQRMASELRYAEIIYDYRPANDMLRFDGYPPTYHLSRPKKRIRFSVSSGELIRRYREYWLYPPPSWSSETDQVMIGSSASSEDYGVYVADGDFKAVPMVLISGQLIDITTGLPLEDAVAVRLELTVSSSTGETATTQTIVQLRNKQ